MSLAALINKSDGIWLVGLSGTGIINDFAPFLQKSWSKSRDCCGLGK